MVIQYNNENNVSLLGQAYVNREFSLLLLQGSTTQSIHHESRGQFLFAEDTALSEAIRKRNKLIIKE